MAMPFLGPLLLRPQRGFATPHRPLERALAAGAALLALGLAGCSSDDLSVPLPDAEERQATAEQLAKATQVQGICYGWSLDGPDTTGGNGSNLGGNVAVESDPQRCPKWVRVRASVTYVPESSESEDSATVWVDTSPNLTVGPAIMDGLKRLGLDEKAFVDDPALAISRAALALPLLTAESGAAEPAPVPSAATTVTPPPLEAAGSDFWRDRLGYIVAAAIILLVAGALGVIGAVQRSQTRRRSGLTKPAQKPAAEKGSAGGANSAGGARTNRTRLDRQP